MPVRESRIRDWFFVGAFALYSMVSPAQIVNPGSGSNTATGINGATAPNSVPILATNSTGQLVQTTQTQFNTYLTSPGPIGGTAPSIGAFTTANSSANSTFNGTIVGTGMVATGFIGFDTGTGGFAGSGGTAIYYGGGNGLTLRGTSINDSSNQCQLNAGSLTCQVPGNFPAIQTATNCASSVGTCGSAASGSVTVAAAATTRTVSTTAIGANSAILLTFDASLGTRLGVTCNTTPSTLSVSARTAGTSFVVTTAAPTTNPDCLSYLIINQ